MNHVTLEQLDRGEYSKKRLMALISDLDSTFIPPISSMTNIVEYCDKLMKYAEVFIAKLTGDDLGFIAIYANDNEQQYAFISSIGVRDKFRQKGIGALLLNRAVEIAREKGMHRILLEVSIENHAALQLYSRYGFSKIDNSIQKQQSNSIILERRLDSV